MSYVWLFPNLWEFEEQLSSKNSCIRNNNLISNMKLENTEYFLQGALHEWSREITCSSQSYGWYILTIKTGKVLAADLSNIFLTFFSIFDLKQKNVLSYLWWKIHEIFDKVLQSTSILYPLSPWLLRGAYPISWPVNCS